MQDQWSCSLSCIVVQKYCFLALFFYEWSMCACNVWGVVRWCPSFFCDLCVRVWYVALFIDAQLFSETYVCVWGMRYWSSTFNFFKRPMCACMVCGVVIVMNHSSLFVSDCEDSMHFTIRFNIKHYCWFLTEAMGDTRVGCLSRRGVYLIPT